MCNNMKKMNPYKIHLDRFFNRIIELRHIALLINSNLKKSVEHIESLELNGFLSASALVISDWTGITDNGWVINFHTGIRKITYKEDYKIEVENIISQECCNAFAQSFEALERFFKDSIYTKIQTDFSCKTQLGFSSDDIISRDNLPGGEKLFELIKKAGKPHFRSFSDHNNNNIKFKEFWFIISQARHAIVHSNAQIDISKIDKSKTHTDIFLKYFNSLKTGDNILIIKLDYRMLDRVLKSVSEFAFQIFKALSLNSGHEWNIRRK